MMLETTKEERATVLKNLEGVADDAEVLVEAEGMRRLCRDVNALVVALEGVMGGCVTGNHAGKSFLACRSCAAARELLQEAPSAKGEGITGGPPGQRGRGPTSMPRTNEGRS